MKTIQNQLQKDIMEELQWEPSLDSSRVGVSVENGVVILSGHVRSFAERQAAERAAKRVRGVWSMANELEVELLSSYVRDDVQIAKAVQSALQWSVVVPDDKIKTTVSKGWVTLEGEVPFAYQRTAAENSVAQLTGVIGVTNRITIRPGVAPTDVRRQLNSALHRHAQLEAEHITTETMGSKVILGGKVRSWAEREVAEEAAWAARGVTNVENRIEVRA